MKPPLKDKVAASAKVVAVPARAAAKPVQAVLEFVPEGTLPGIVLIVAALAALAAANSPLADAYAGLWERALGPLSLGHWIDDALMAIFFFQIGLEMKREIVEGHLSTAAARRVPVVAAAAGMIAPAFVYVAASGADPPLMRGWAIPAATDIAFALGVLTLLGDRVPGSLRLFLTSVAIADDMGAVAIIAAGYTTAIDPLALAIAAGLLGLLWLANRCGVLALWPYALLGVGLWAAVYASGVHATIAGVLTALFVPLGRGEARGPLEDTERALAPYVAYLVLPLFGFANAGVTLGGATVLAPLPIAIALGLFVGKQAGVFAALRAMAALGIGRPPEGASWLQLYGVALLAGIGFTTSLFITGLAFADPVLVAQAKTGILAGSLLSGIAGFAVLRLARGPAAQ